jgi:hypothetical protein
MSDIPLDLQRRCEQRWAARFLRPAQDAALKKQQPQAQSEHLAAPSKRKRKARRVALAALTPVRAG